MRAQDVRINRSLPLGKHMLTDLCDGIGRLPVMKRILGKRYRSILRNQKIRISRTKMYAYIDDKDGTIVIGQGYLRKGRQEYLCLDMIHELVHIRQFHDGKDLFDRRFRYSERPTEIEAYRVAAAEAKKMGMRGRELREYLVVDWITKDEFAKLLKEIGVR